MTYFQEIEEIIKTHPEIPQAVVYDVLKRSRDWLEAEWATEMDNYILAQLRYARRFIAE